MPSSPMCVSISDVHFSLNTLRVATEALSAALRSAEQLNVPLVIQGDLNDTKAIIRAEVANTIISVLKPAKTPVYILEGNHDKVNEKGDEHGLNYLRPYAKVIDRTCAADFSDHVAFMPYQNSTDKVRENLALIKPGWIVLMHQGVLGAFMGDYKRDETSVDPGALASFVCISGHYHRHQQVGTLTYIGSPYTITFGEANDGDKGFLIVNTDGSWSRQILRLRKHIIVERTVEQVLAPIPNLHRADKLWLKVTGPYAELQKIRKKDVGMALLGHQNFNFDRIYTDAARFTPSVRMSSDDIMDKIIDNQPDGDDQRAYLKQLWREAVNASH